MLGVSPFTVMNWEANETEPGPRDGPKIVAWLRYLPLPTESRCDKFYAIRFARGWTQRHLAEALGVGEDAVRDAEGGRVLSAALTTRMDVRIEALLAEVTAAGRRDEGE